MAEGGLLSTESAKKDCLESVEMLTAWYTLFIKRTCHFMSYDLCLMCYDLCLMCYDLCLMCYELCLMCYDLCLMC